MIDQLDRAKLGPLFKEARQAKNMTLEQFYGEIATHVNNFSAIENGSRVVGKRLSKDIISHHGINLKWLESGEGDPFLEATVIRNQAGQKQGFLEQASMKQVPYYNLQLVEQVYDEGDVFRETPEFYVNFQPFNDCTAYLPVYGDSMLPRFVSGEIIAIKEVRNFDVILWGEAYLIATNERANHLVTVKLLFEHADENKLILRAANPAYPGDTVIEKRAIARLFIIKGKITRSQF